MGQVNFPVGTLVILTTAPAGLGHIRVLEALRQGLDTKTRVIVMGSRDVKMQALHRATSVNPYFRNIMEFVQNNPIVEGGFTRWYRQILRQNPEEIAQTIEALIYKETAPVKTVIIVSTHFGLAHQIAAAKVDLQQRLKCKLILVVVVTDDSPQAVWAVGGADILFTPSESTRAALELEFARMNLPLPQIKVVPYPVGPDLARSLNLKQIEDRFNQTDPDNKAPLKLMIPISGAAVQLGYFQDLLNCLQTLMPVKVTVVSRENLQTEAFLDWCSKYSFITLLTHQNDLRVVQLYEEAYEKEVYAAEVTKPSEQTFKALLTPKQRGGVSLLFSEPVGRQEDDNLLFLSRHHLLPDLPARLKLDQLPVHGEKRELMELLAAAGRWRGLMLPSDGSAAGVRLYAWRKCGILAPMVHFGGFMKGHEELSDDGVEKIWQLLQHYG